MHKKKLLIFDYDGVIVDSIEVIRKAYNSVHAHYNMPYADTHEAISKKLEKNFFQTLADYGLTQEQITKYFHEIKEKIESYEDQIMPFPDMQTLLAQTAALYSCAIVTSGHKETVMKVLTRYNMHNHFRLLLGADSEQSKVRKIEKTLAHFGIEKEYTYFISDTSGDILEGKEVGVTTIGVSWGYHTKETLASANPDYLFETVGELEKFLLHV